MAESTLSPDYVVFRRAVGNFLGLNPDLNWVARDVTRVDDIIDAGYRRVLSPPVELTNGVPWVWPFLHPLDTLTTAADQSTYDLPDDFGGHEGPLTYEPGTSALYGPIEWVSEAQIRFKLQHDQTLTSRPQYAGLRPKTFNPTVGLRWEVVLWPTPDAEYNLKYKYNVLVGKLDTTNKYPIGGLMVGQAVLQACLAVAEERQEQQRGVHYAQFVEALRAAIAYHQRTTAPEFLGYNRDYSDGMVDDDALLVRQFWDTGSFVTYNGELPFGA